MEKLERGMVFQNKHSGYDWKFVYLKKEKRRHPYRSGAYGLNVVLVGSEPRIEYGTFDYQTLLTDRENFPFLGKVDVDSINRSINQIWFDCVQSPEPLA